MIVLFSDFGADDIYVAQMKAVLLRDAPQGTPLLDLLHAAPNFDIRASAHLLAALAVHFPRGSVFLAIVDPGVGGSRAAAALEADGRWFVGPDNGLLSVVQSRAAESAVWRIVWQPQDLSASFHGRDLFAPVAARIAGGRIPEDVLEPATGLDISLGPDDLAEIIYIDHYGNALTGLRAAHLPRTAHVEVGGRRLGWARTFSDVPPGTPFWYENSIGLVEISVNCCNAAAELGLRIADPVSTELHGLVHPDTKGNRQ